MPFNLMWTGTRVYRRRMCGCKSGKVAGSLLSKTCLSCCIASASAFSSHLQPTRTVSVPGPDDGGNSGR